MRNVYCIEKWWLENEPVRDSFWSNIEEPWKLGRFSFVEEYDSEEKFKAELLTIINSGGVIGKVFIKQVDENYKTSIKL